MMPAFVHKKHFIFLTENVSNYPMQIITTDSSFMDRCYSSFNLNRRQTFDIIRQPSSTENTIKVDYNEIFNFEDIIPLDVIMNTLKDIEKHKNFNNEQRYKSRKLYQQKKFGFLNKNLEKLKVFQALCLWTNIPPSTSISLNQLNCITNIRNSSILLSSQNSLVPNKTYLSSFESIKKILETSNVIIDDYNSPDKIELFILKNANQFSEIKNETVINNGIKIYAKNKNPLAGNISNELQIFECQVQSTPSKHSNKSQQTTQTVKNNKIVIIKESNDQHQINEFSTKIMQDLCKELDLYIKQINESRIIENKILADLEICLQERQCKPIKRGKYTCKMTHSNMLLMNRTKLKNLNSNNTKNIPVQSDTKKQSKIPKYQYNSNPNLYNQNQGDTFKEKSKNKIHIEDDGYNCPLLFYELEKTFIKHLEDHHKFITNLHKVRNSQYKKMISKKLKQFELLLNNLTNDINSSNEESETNSDQTFNSNSRNDLFSNKYDLNHTSSDDDIPMKETGALNLYNILSDHNIPTLQTDVLVLENKLSTFLFRNIDEESNSSSIKETESKNNCFCNEKLNNLFTVQLQQNKMANEKNLSTSINDIQYNEKFLTCNTNNIFSEILNKQTSLLSSIYNNDNFVQLFETIFHPFYSKRSSYNIHCDFNKADQYANQISTENIITTPKSNMSLYNFEENIDLLFRKNRI